MDLCSFWTWISDCIYLYSICGYAGFEMFHLAVPTKSFSDIIVDRAANNLKLELISEMVCSHWLEHHRVYWNITEEIGTLQNPMKLLFQNSSLNSSGAISAYTIRQNSEIRFIRDFSIFLLSVMLSKCLSFHQHHESDKKNLLLFAIANNIERQ